MAPLKSTIVASLALSAGAQSVVTTTLTLAKQGGYKGLSMFSSMTSMAYDNGAVELYVGNEGALELAASGKYELKDNSTTTSSTLSGGCVLDGGGSCGWYCFPCKCTAVSIIDPDSTTGKVNMVCDVVEKQDGLDFSYVTTAQYSFTVK